MATPIVTAPIAISENRKTILDEHQRALVLRVLIIGLTALGSIEEIRNTLKLRELAEHDADRDDYAAHPTGAADTVSQFAEALSYLQGGAA